MAQLVYYGKNIICHVIDGCLLFSCVHTASQVLGCSLENSQIRQCYGYGTFFLAIYCLSFWHLLTLDSSTANPCCHIMKYVQGKSSWQSVTLSILAQCIGAALSWQIARLFWLSGLTAGHRERFSQPSCQSDLTVSVSAGVLIESLACVVDCLLSIKIFTKHVVVEQHVKIILLCLITVTGKHFYFLIDCGDICTLQVIN